MPRKKTTKGKKIQIGNKVLIYGKHVGEMLDSNDMYNNKDFDGLRKKLEKEGYLFIRGVIPNNYIAAARKSMLTQAAKENCIVVDQNNDLDRARMKRRGNKWPDGYCVDGVTGAETNERNNIDTDAWEKIGPSKICKKVYNGIHLQKFWKSLFGAKTCKPLVKQTFLRLMGSSGTIEHADYYYFKRDTHVFTGNDGLNAQKAAMQYLKTNNMWDPDIYETKEHDQKYDDDNDNDDDDDDTELVCGVCSTVYKLSQLDDARKQRYKANKHSDFGTEGEWHCAKCAKLPLSVYTTWISLSALKAPKDSILAMIPESHLLKLWDLPQKKSQVPGDFNWKYKWVIPKTVDFGDIIIFNIKTIHASSLNTSSPRTYRCSFDTRLQLIPNSNNNINKKPNAKKKSRKFAPSPHPGMKFKKLIDDNDENDDRSNRKDLSESLGSLHL